MRKAIKPLVAKPNPNKISVVVFVAVGEVSLETVMDIWHKAYKFQSWDLSDFTIDVPSKKTINKVRRIVNLSLL